MSLWRDFFEGVTEGILNSSERQTCASPHNERHSDYGRIDRLCEELGWGIDERSDDGETIYLRFDAPDGIREVQISCGDDCVVLFNVVSAASLRARDIPVDMLVYLLHHNLKCDGLGMWGITIEGGKKVRFHHMYQALGDGLEPGVFKFICQSLIKEAVDFDDKLREEGLLR